MEARKSTTPKAQLRAMQARQGKNRVPHVTVAGVEKKSCATCAKLKALKEFRQDLNRWDGLQAECGACRDEFWQIERVKRRERRAPTPRIDPRARRSEEGKLALAEGWRAIHDRLERKKAAESVAKAAEGRKAALASVEVPPSRLRVTCRACGWRGSVENRGLASKCRHCGSLDLVAE